MVFGSLCVELLANRLRDLNIVYGAGLGRIKVRHDLLHGHGLGEARDARLWQHEPVSFRWRSIGVLAVAVTAAG